MQVHIGEKFERKSPTKITNSKGIYCGLFPPVHDRKISKEHDKKLGNHVSCGI